MISERSLDPAGRRRLFAVATQAFGEHGFERASLNAILASAGMGKSTFFYYFTDKTDLFASVLEDAFTRVAAAAGPIGLPEVPARFFPDAAAVIERWGMAVASEPGFVGLLRALQPMRRGASPRLRGVMDEVRGAYRALLARGVELGVVRSDVSVDTLVAIIEAVDTVLDDEFHRDRAPDAARLTAHRALVLDFVQRLVRTP